MAEIITSAEVEEWYVTPSWVAAYYEVTRLEVHRAIAARRLIAARVRGAKHAAWVLDRRLLPKEFPRG